MYLSKQTQTPRSSFTQVRKSILYPNAKFHEVFDPSLGTIAQQRKKLKIDREKLFADMKEVEERLQKIELQLGVVKEIEQDLESLNSSSPIFKDSLLGKEAKSQISLLRKIGADLKQQIIYVQDEIDDAQIQLQKMAERDQENDETIRLVEKKIHEKEVEVQKLRDLADALNSDILMKENEVFQLELKAVAHQEKLDKLSNDKRELLYKKYDIIINQELLFNEVKRIEKELHQFTERDNLAKTQLTNALDEANFLDRKEMDLMDKEKYLREENEKLNRLKYEISKKKIIDVQRRLQYKETTELQQIQEMRELAKEEDEIVQEIEDLEFQNEIDEKRLDTKERSLNITRESQEKAFLSRQTKLLYSINLIQDKLNKSKPQGELEEVIRQGREDNERMANETIQMKKDIEEIKKAMMPEDELNKKKEFLQKQVKVIMIQEREINSKLGAINAEEREIEHDEEEMRQNMSVIEAEKSLTKKNDDAVVRIRKICKDQLEQLMKKYKALSKNDGDGNE
ncbi:hypothetical protein TRFO_03195 [Tritrichomonas foetus]|uniref:Uncharacterized protein n=1 Tax=Tritrichomonas foetus TaxID=1144522 RepID=A0A1J4KTE1_9EUKA|nr:hypothetical protein TRFO_03195 [Tritrichomonas foetus]|eukprot:OHT14152.1 hypothetical protein TRFO_03195 [Tritrichomonas foetus]